MASLQGLLVFKKNDKYKKTCFLATLFQNEKMFYVQETSMDITSLGQAVKKICP